MKDLLIDQLTNILNNNTLIKAEGHLEMNFARNSATSVTATYSSVFPVTAANATLLNSLINATKCEVSNIYTTSFADVWVDVAIGLSTKATPEQLEQ